MLDVAQHNRLFRLMCLLALLVSPLRVDAAEAMWDSVFAYQQKMANYGQPEAQVKLGEMYEDGLGTEQSFDSAGQWYQKALDQGFAPAQEKLNKLQQRRQQAADAVLERERRQLREKEELKRQEQERKAREAAEAAQAEIDRAEKERAAKEHLAQEEEKERTRQQEEDKRRAQEEEQLARQRAAEAMKKMLAVPGGYEQ
jgi:septal ring factor EnvC (AmiA/AmiB activator)